MTTYSLNHLSDVEAELICKVKAEFSHCWTLNDPGHRFDHFMAVYRTAKLLNVKYSELHPSVQPSHWREMMLVAFFHDLFSWSRDNHHTLAEHFLNTTRSSIVHALTEHDNSKLARCSKACAEHRASFKGVFSSSLSEIMSAADRGLPVFTDTLVERAIAFRLNNNMDKKTARQEAIRHVKEKYGRHGYARFPDFYMACFKEELEYYWNKIDAL